MVLSSLPAFTLLCLSSGVLGQGQLQLQTPLQFQSNQTASCHNACTSLVSILGEKVYHENIPHSLFAEYFSALQQEIVPACFILPRSPRDVSDAIKIIIQHRCIFAVKSGGHAMFSGASNAPGGITLDLQYLNDLDISPDHSTAYVGPGNRWADVYDFLDPMNLTAVGGRDSQVGVGGFLLGGGISLISRRFGWGCDNVRSYEIVLANGSISNISLDSHPDLYWALRGGGKNFGIITRFDIETHPQGPMWGDFNVVLLSDIEEEMAALGVSGSFSWTPAWFLSKGIDLVIGLGCKFGYCTTLDKFTEMLSDLSADIEPDPYAQVYGYLVRLPYLNKWIVGGQLNHGAGLTNASSLARFRSIKAIFSSQHVSNSTSFAKEVASFNKRGGRTSFRTATLKVSAPFMKQLANMFVEEVEGIRHVKRLIASYVVQPITKAEIEKFSKNGGNALGIKEEDGPLFLILAAFGWAESADDELVNRVSANFVDKAIKLSKEMGVNHPYIYSNYAAKGQDVYAGYGAENRQRLREIQKKYDPEEILSRLQPGYFQV